MAKKKSSAKPSSPAQKKITLIVSDSPNPSISVSAGHRFEVVTVDMHDASTQKPAAMAARLCGGTSTCLALIDVSE